MIVSNKLCYISDDVVKKFMLGKKLTVLYNKIY